MISKKFFVNRESESWARKLELNFWSSQLVDSTNNRAKKEAFTIKDDFKLYLADHQTAGKGRGENLWHSHAGGDYLLSSWSFGLSFDPQHLTGPLIGLCLFESVKNVWPDLNWSIKAPNDLLINGKKLSGLLVECIHQGTQHRLIIGLGMNIGSHPEQEKNSTDLQTELKKQSLVLTVEDWQKFLTNFYQSLNRQKELWKTENLTEMTREQLLKSLNANPNLNKKYDEVLASGDLVRGSKTVSWMEL